MEFSLSGFVKRGLICAIRRHGEDWVRLNAAAWHRDGVLTVEDLVEIDTILKAKNGEREVAGDDLKV